MYIDDGKCMECMLNLLLRLFYSLVRKRFETKNNNIIFDEAALKISIAKSKKGVLLEPWSFSLKQWSLSSKPWSFTFKQ